MATPSAKAEPLFWQLPVTVLMEHLGSSPEGLSSAEAALRLAHFGPNLIHAERKRALILQFLAKFRNPLVIIRTRKNPFKSRPNPWLITCSLTVVAVAVLLPFTPAGAYLGYVAPPGELSLKQCVGREWIVRDKFEGEAVAGGNDCWWSWRAGRMTTTGDSSHESLSLFP